MHKDLWLQAWLPLLTERAGGVAVLELGCGGGDDSETLVTAGLALIAIDCSESAIATARQRVPQAQCLCQDIKQSFPVEPCSTGVVLASLCLHYFSWLETVVLVERVRTVLRPGGVLLCRLNSTNDSNYGAVGHPAIEDNFYLVKGEPKRFFDRPAVDALFNHGWKTLSMEEKTTHKYAMPKVLWEVALERVG